MNTFNEFELNRIKKLYADDFALRRHTLQRSRSTKVNGAQQPTCWPAQRSHQRPRQLDEQRRQNLIGVHTRSYLLRDEQDFAGQPDLLLAAGSSAAATPDVVNLKRYQQALANKKRARRVGGRSASTIGATSSSSSSWAASKFGRALYDFQAASGQELSLKRGDLVELLEVLEGNKWARVEDCQSGLQGLAPLSYLDHSIGCAVAKRDVNTAAAASSSALSTSSRPNSRMSSGPAPKEAPPHSLLAMNKGEPIALIRRLSGHLYEASNTRQATGLVWSNDLDIIKQPAGGSAGGLDERKQMSAQPQLSDEFTDDDDDDDQEEGEEDSQDELLGDQMERPIVRYHHNEEEDEQEEEEEEIILLDSGERVLARGPRQRPRAKSASGAYNERPPSLGQANVVVKQTTSHLYERHERNHQTRPRMHDKQWSCCCKQSSGAGHRQQQQQQVCCHEPRRSSSSPMISTASGQQASQQVAAGQEAAQQAALPRLCRARYGYKPRQKDELELIPDDILVVVHECDDGWFIGSSYATKQMGTFPGNFVEPIHTTN